MTLQKREKILAGVVGGLLLLTAFYYGGFAALRGNSQRRTDRNRLADDVAKKQASVDKAERSFGQMAVWERQSLPSNRESAQSLYYKWLTQLVDQSKFRRPRIEPTEGRDVKGAYRIFPFTVRGQAALDQVVQFLFAFYSEGHLQQIRHLSMKPLENTQDLDVSIQIEAISLPAADRTDKLTTEPSNRLGKAKIDEYRKLIVGRNPFAPYKPLPPGDTKPLERPSEPDRPKFDPSKYAYLTGITSKNGEPLAWIVSRTTDQTLQLKEGDPLEIGPLKGKVLWIGLRKIEVQTDDGANYTLALGRSLRDAADGDKKAEGKPDRPTDRPSRPDGGPGDPRGVRPDGERRSGPPGEPRGEPRGDGGSDDSRSSRRRR